MITDILCNHYLKHQPTKFVLIFFFYKVNFARNNNHNILSVTLSYGLFKLEGNFM